MGGFNLFCFIIPLVLLLVAIVAVYLALIGAGLVTGSFLGKRRDPAGEPSDSAQSRRSWRPGLVIGGVALCISFIILYPMAIAVGVIVEDILQQKKNEANERAVVARLRALIAAEKSYGLANGGFYDTPRCMARPRFCMPRYSGAPFLDAETASLRRRNGYVVSFHPGPVAKVGVDQRGKVSPSSVTDYAFDSVRVEGSAGPVRLCADFRGFICRMDRDQQIAARCPCTHSDY
jgi:hypothetical protein